MGHERTSSKEQGTSAFQLIAGVLLVGRIDNSERLSSGLRCQRERVWWKRTSEHDALVPASVPGLWRWKSPISGVRRSAMSRPTNPLRKIATLSRAPKETRYTPA